MPTPHSPIGIFDSGVGGLSVLQALRHELPHEQFVYLADSGNAPYGDARGDAFVQERSLAIAKYLLEQHDIKILVIACNTATAAAVELLRERLPQLPVIGVEPAIKPASFSSQTHHVGVMATRGTISSQRVARLVSEHGQRAEFHLQACDGLARAIEQSTEQALPEDASATEIRALCAKYTSALGSFGLKTGQMDTLVLGCTHYVFVKDDLRALLGPDIQFLDTGPRGTPDPAHAGAAQSAGSRDRWIAAAGPGRSDSAHDDRPPDGHASRGPALAGSARRLQPGRQRVLAKRLGHTRLICAISSRAARHPGPDS